MKIGFNMLVVGSDLDVTDHIVFQRMKALGYDGAEVPVFDLDEARCRRVGAMLAEIGLEATGAGMVTPDANPLSDKESVRRRGLDRLRRTIDCTAALGGRLVAGPIHSPVGHFTGQAPTPTELERLVDAMRMAAEHGEGSGVLVIAEAVNRFESYVMTTMALASEIYRRVDHPHYGSMFDTFHANIEERDPVAAFERHASEIRHYHVSENDRGVPGRGHVPFPQHFEALRRSGYDGWITIEAFGRAVPALAGATRVWRDLFEDRDTLFADGIALVRREWDAAGRRLAERPAA